MKTNDPKKTDKAGETDFPGYPHYSSKDDIYSKEKETEVDPEHTDKLKRAPEKVGEINEKNFGQDKTGGDLDVPGADLDDEQEDIGSEDEENNIYSQGDTE